MTETEKKYLSDIISAIKLIQEFTVNIDSFGDYANDLKTKSAVERQLGILGEAVNKFRKISRKEIRKSEQIVNFRNRLIHAYDSIDDTIVWTILKKYLNPLKKEVEKLIER